MFSAKCKHRRPDFRPASHLSPGQVVSTLSAPSRRFSEAPRRLLQGCAGLGVTRGRAVGGGGVPREAESAQSVQEQKRVTRWNWASLHIAPELLTPRTSQVTLQGGRVFTDGIKLKRGCPGGPSPMWPVSSGPYKSWTWADRPCTGRTPHRRSTRQTSMQSRTQAPGQTVPGTRRGPARPPLDCGLRQSLTRCAPRAQGLSVGPVRGPAPPWGGHVPAGGITQRTKTEARWETASRGLAGATGDPDAGKGIGGRGARRCNDTQGAKQRLGVEGAPAWMTGDHFPQGKLPARPRQAASEGTARKATPGDTSPNPAAQGPDPSGLRSFRPVDVALPLDSCGWCFVNCPVIRPVTSPLWCYRIVSPHRH